MAFLCWFAFHRAATVGATVLAREKWPIRASLRPLDIYIYVFGSQSCATRLIFAGSAPLAAAKQAAQCTLGCWANGACVRRSLRGKARLLPRAASTVRSAILRRRNTGSSSRSRPLAHHANCRRAVPLRSLLTHAPLARPSIRRVCFRSICARRCSIDSLNLVRVRFAATLIDMLYMTLFYLTLSCPNQRPYATLSYLTAI